MAIKTWTGAGANNNWNTALNWSGGTIPVAADDIVFDGVFPLTGNKNCTYNVSISVTSINFTGYLGQFTFSNNLIVTGSITLGAGASYATSATVTTYTLTTGTATTLTFNGKSLPVNYAPGGSGTQTFVGNADFQGNYTVQNTAYNIKAAATTTIDLRIGGNISFGACTTNVTDHVTLKAYGTAKTFAASTVSFNQRVSFVPGSIYTNLGNHGSGGTSFYTVESGGQFNALNNTNNFSNGGTLTLSGFNSSNNSDFISINSGGTYVLSNDTVIKGFINITTAACTISTSVGAKILLEGNLTSASIAITTIDYLEFSGTALSTVSAVTTNNLQIKNLSFNKTGAGSVNFTSTNFILVIPTLTTYTWTHTSGTITQSSTSRIVIACATPTSTYTYSESISLTTPFTFSQLIINGGILSLNSTLRATRLYLGLSLLTTTFTSSGLLGFNVDILNVINSLAGTRTITLKSGCTYTINAQLYMSSINGTTGQITLNASVVSGTRAYFNLDNNASQLVEYVTATDIDSSGTLNVAPFTKQLIYTFLGVLTRTSNWAVGAQPPPVLPSRTVAYTFVN